MPSPSFTLADESGTRGNQRRGSTLSVVRGKCPEIEAHFQKKIFMQGSEEIISITDASCKRRRGIWGESTKEGGTTNKGKATKKVRIHRWGDH